ncbi:MAG: hypothetical protein HOV80_19785 [Polyangiaceae bacterium]|nr:hypothetical protein [Polyangiaceae bacterium]
MLLALAAMASLSSACGDDTETKDSPPPDPEPALFDRQPEPNGPRLWLDATRGGDGIVRIEVHGAELGEVFGWAAHVRWDAETLTVDAGGVAETLGGDAEAARLLSLQEGDASLGEARRGTALGGQAIDEPVVLATLDVGSDSGPSELSLERAIVRRADGSYVEITTAGGLLRPEGSTP